MTDTPQDLAYSRLFARYDEALERISVLSRENIALQKATQDQQAELEFLWAALRDIYMTTRCIKTANKARATLEDKL